RACGSGACAAAGTRRQGGGRQREARSSRPGGDLRIQWPGDGQPVVMAGPTAFVFEGEWMA
ncbi:MAG TPA: diaminopimelate epimerase, partial [Pseudomonas sp.]|nr:diaminopimelate epimerase [Pseudomonas sp.]